MFLVLLALASTAGAADPAEPVARDAARGVARDTLAPDSPITGRLNRTGSRSYRLPASGNYRVSLQQGPRDFAIDILEPDGVALRRTVDAFSYGLETASQVRGPAMIRVRRMDTDRSPAGFTLNVAPLPAAAVAAARAEDAATSARAASRRGSADGRVEGVRLAREALRLWQETGEAGAILRASLLVADALHLTASHDEALEWYTRLLPATEESAQSRAECLANRGSTYWRLGRFSDALRDMDESLEIWKSLGGAGLASIRNNRGLILWEIGSFEESLREFHEAAAAMRVAYPKGLPVVLNNTGLVEGTLGDYAAAVRSFGRAAALLDASGDRLASGRALLNSASMYLKLRDVTRAGIAAHRALSLVESSGNRPAIAEALNVLGQVFTAQGRTDDSLDRFHKALSIARTIQEPRIEANALTGIGRVLIKAGGRAAGIAFLKDSLSLWRRFGSPAVESSVLFQLATAHRDSGDLAAAEESIQAALGIAENLRTRVSALDMRVGFLADRVQFYDAAIDILERSGKTEQAWSVAEMSRARTLVESVAAAGAENADETRLHEQVNSESLRLARASSRDAEAGRKRLDQLTAQLAARATAPAMPVASLSAVQRALPADAAVLEYAAGDSGYAWVITKDAISSFPLRGPRRLASSAAALAGVMRSGPPSSAAENQYRESARILASTIIWPALAAIGPAKRILIVSDSRLDFPIAALPLPEGGALIDRFEVWESPSAGMLVQLAARNDPDTWRRAAIFADPVFDRGDSRVDGPADGAASAIYSRLVFSGREAKAIGSLLPEPDRLLLLGFDVTKQAFSGGRLRGYPVVHISTHASPIGTQPALVLSLVNRDGSTRDGLLTSGEFAASDLRDAALVVLNACHSSGGPAVTGEGILNMARSAILGGAQRVIATRWPVTDEAAGRMFERFYTLMWKSGLPPVSALRQAQLSLRDEERFRSPYYWAPYYLVGKL